MYCDSAVPRHGVNRQSGTGFVEDRHIDYAGVCWVFRVIRTRAQGFMCVCKGAERCTSLHRTDKGPSRDTEQQGATGKG